MLSVRLKTIASLVDPHLSVVDIGTDHAYIPIYLVEFNITNNVLAADISEKVLKSARENIKKHGLEDKIKISLSDGFTNIDETYDIAIISGMGTSTIKEILNASNIPNTLIIQSNNDLDILRKYMNDLGYKIDQEVVVFENKKYYSIIKYVKGKEALTKEELLFGKSKNKEYFTYLSQKYLDLYNKSKNEKFKDYCATLEKIIEKIQA